MNNVRAVADRFVEEQMFEEDLREVLKLMRQMFLVRIETLKKRKWGRQRLD